MVNWIIILVIFCLFLNMFGIGLLLVFHKTKMNINFDTVLLDTEEMENRAFLDCHLWFSFNFGIKD